jgi:glycosyltransferase involved in cell wall biosynthesis
MIFSVIISVRNEIEYIEKCIKSIYTQQFDEPFEIIIIDGMSTDGTIEILNKLKKEYKFKLFKNEKINAAAGRNIGIKNSKGKYIAFIDGDAIASTNWLKNIKKTIEKQKENVAGVGGPDELPKDSELKAKRIGHVMTSSLARGGSFNPSTQHSMNQEECYVEHIPTCNLCLKKGIFESVGYFDEDFVKGQDLELNYRIIKSGYKLLYSPKIKVVHYRKNHIRTFSKQIYKWAKAKVAIIRKHGFDGLLSHIYLWPLYFTILLTLMILFSYLINILPIFAFLFLTAFLSYGIIITYEANRLKKEFNDPGLFLFSLILFPVVHMSYYFGALFAIFKKKIWD